MKLSHKSTMRANNHQRDSLKHQCPDTHSETQFAALIASIPKRVDQHTKQAEHIKTLVKTGWRVRRILDVGAGEGTFTNLALELLKNEGALTNDRGDKAHVDVIEKD